MLKQIDKKHAVTRHNTLRAKMPEIIPYNQFPLHRNRTPRIRKTIPARSAAIK